MFQKAKSADTTRKLFYKLTVIKKNEKRNLRTVDK